MEKKKFSDFFSELEEYYFDDLNLGINFADLHVTFPEKLFWSCESGHINYQTPRIRTKNKCKTCSHNKSRKFLWEFHPQILDDFDVDLNEDVDPRYLFSRSVGNFWWKCKESDYKHSYEATVRAKIAGRRCPYCAGLRILPGFNDWQTLVQLESLVWDDSKNLGEDGQPVKKDLLGVDNRELRYWICLTGNHERVISISSAINGQRQGKKCRTCSGYKAKNGVNDVASLYPELVERVDARINPSTILIGLHPGSELEVHWRCKEGHVWARSIREELRARGCNKCLGRDVWEGHNDIASQFPELAKELARDLNALDKETEDLPPEQIHKGSNSRFWWRCISFGHTWKTSVQKRTLEGTGCPYCSDRRVWSGFNDLFTKRPDLVNEIDFDKTTNLDPRKLLWVSHEKIFWKCQEGHGWEAKLVSRTQNAGKRPTGCPDCADYGFNPHEEAIIYVVHLESKQTLKVGITNTSTNRLSAWNNKGWKTVTTFVFEHGSEAIFIEKAFHTWRRHVMEVPNKLTASDTGRLGGWTETFDATLLSELQVVAKIGRLIRDRFVSSAGNNI